MQEEKGRRCEQSHIQIDLIYKLTWDHPLCPIILTHNYIYTIVLVDHRTNPTNTASQLCGFSMRGEQGNHDIIAASKENEKQKGREK